MLSPQDLLNTIHEQVSQILPDASKSVQDDMAANLKILVGGIVSRLDLVSREEFDAQQLVLERTREKLEQLEGEVAKLEARLSAS